MVIGKTKNQESIMVSIFCMVYNHGPFIRKCLEGFLMQKCNFNYQIVIGEDCSTDNSRAIILEYANKYPTMFKLLLHENNVGAAENQRIVFENCKGKYIAMCEGDDYWTDPLKLQKQVDFLEKNNDFSICFHKVKILKNNKLVKDYITNVPNDITSITDIAKRNYIHTPSVLFRNGLIKNFPSWYFLSPNGDHPLYLLLSQYGKIKFLDSTMAVYRVHIGGSWSLKRKNNLSLINKTINVQKLMIDDFEGDIKNILKENLSISYLELADYYYKENKFPDSLEAFKQSTLYTHEVLYKRYYKYKKILDPIKKIVLTNSILSYFFKKLKTIIK